MPTLMIQGTISDADKSTLAAYLQGDTFTW